MIFLSSEKRVAFQDHSFQMQLSFLPTASLGLIPEKAEGGLCYTALLLEWWVLKALK